MSSCIPEDRLLAFARSEVSPEESASIDTHLDMCTRCQESIDRITQQVLQAILPQPFPLIAEVRPEVPGYRVVRELGRGGMGIVWLAEQLSLKRLVALKTIRVQLGSNTDELSRRLQIEAEAIGRLAHPNIVRVFETGNALHGPYFTMEYIEGGSLKDLLGGMPWEPGRAARHIANLAYAIHRAHEAGIVHRDLKPSNILLERAEAEITPKISDFGLAKILDQPGEETLSGRVLGTPNYMAPEQASGTTGVIGPATDIHALGSLLYELITGRPPFQGATPMETYDLIAHHSPIPPSRLVTRIPRDLEVVCLRALEKEPRNRFRSAKELADDLTRFLNHEPIRTRPPSLIRRCVLVYRRHFARCWIVSLLSLSAVILVAWAFTTWGNWNRREAALAETLAAIDGRQKEGLPWEGLLERAEAIMQSGRVPDKLATEVLHLRTTATERKKDAALLARLRELSDQLSMTEKLGVVEVDILLPESSRPYPLRETFEGLPVRALDDQSVFNETEIAFANRVGNVMDLTAESVAGLFHGSSTRKEIAVYLTQVAQRGRIRLPNQIDRWKHYGQLADSLDPDPMNIKLRQALLAKANWKELCEIADAYDYERQPALMGVLLAIEARQYDQRKGLEIAAKVFAFHPDQYCTSHYLDLMHKSSTDMGRYHFSMAALRPDNPYVLRRLALSVSSPDKLQKMILDRLVLMAPKDPDSWANLGMYYINSDNRRNAQASFEKAIEYGPDIPQLWRNLAQVYQGNGELEKAISSYLRLIELDPNDHTCRMRLAWLLCTKPIVDPDDGQRAAQVLEPVSKDPKENGNAVFLEILAASHAARGEFTKALELQERAAANEEYRKNGETEIRERLEAYRENRRWFDRSGQKH